MVARGRLLGVGVAAVVDRRQQRIEVERHPTELEAYVGLQHCDHGELRHRGEMEPLARQVAVERQPDASRIEEAVAVEMVSSRPLIPGTSFERTDGVAESPAATGRPT